MLERGALGRLLPRLGLEILLIYFFRCLSLTPSPTPSFQVPHDPKLQNIVPETPTQVLYIGLKGLEGV